MLTSPPRIPSGQSEADSHAELQDELRHIGDLVFLRELLRGRGDTPAELRAYDAVIGEARARLAESVKRSAAPFATAA